MDIVNVCSGETEDFTASVEKDDAGYTLSFTVSSLVTYECLDSELIRSS